MLIISLLGLIASSITCLYLGRLLGTYASILMIVYYTISTLSSIVLSYGIIMNDSTLILQLGTLSSILGMNIELGIDSTSILVVSIIVLVSANVNIYSIYYMSSDAYYIRFIGLLSSFASFMVILVVSNNLITLFICWELIGIFSYLLISYWSDRYLAIISSYKALAMNKVGDYCFILAIVLLLSILYSTELGIINTLYSLRYWCNEYLN